MTIPDYIHAMVRRTAPPGAPVVPSSTPVVSFGDPKLARVATLGINPSAREFQEDGLLLRGSARRLATLESLGADSCDLLTDEQVAKVVAECSSYFRRRPNRNWFNPFDKLLRESIEASYYDGSACHLDLIQWSTNPVWGKICDTKCRGALLSDGVGHLRTQLANESFRLVLLNGREVVDQVVEMGLTNLWDVGELCFRDVGCRLFVGDGGGRLWMGWSTNLQSSFGVSREFKARLADWLGRAATRRCAR